MYGGAVAFQNQISNCVSLQKEGDLPFLFCFTLYLRANSKYKPPRGGWGLYLEGRFTRGFLGGLYLEGVIHGGAYFRNFMVIEKKTLWPLTPYQDPKRYLQVHQVPRIAQFAGYCPIGQIWISYRVQCQSSTILMSSIELPIHHKHQYW